MPSRHGIYFAPPWKAVTGDNGETDIDLDAADYTAYVLLLTIANGSAKNFIEDCYVHFDLNKATTGWGAVATTQTLALAVARKIDGTNYRIGGNTNGDDETPTMTGSVAAVNRGMGIHVGPIGPDEDCQIFVRLSTEAAVSGDVEIPYVVYYRGPAPTITEVEA
jgi:hypothetical protein